MAGRRKTEALSVADLACRALDNPQRWNSDFQSALSEVWNGIASNPMTTPGSNHAGRTIRNHRVGAMDRTDKERRRLVAAISGAGSITVGAEDLTAMENSLPGTGMTPVIAPDMSGPLWLEIPSIRTGLLVEPIPGRWSCQVFRSDLEGKASMSPVTHFHQAGSVGTTYVPSALYVGIKGEIGAVLADPEDERRRLSKAAGLDLGPVLLALCASTLGRDVVARGRLTADDLKTARFASPRMAEADKHVRRGLQVPFGNVARLMARLMRF